MKYKNVIVEYPWDHKGLEIYMRADVHGVHLQAVAQWFEMSREKGRKVSVTKE